MAEQSATTIAMVLEQAYMPLQAMRVPIPVPSGHQVLLKVLACGVCRTDLHIFDGELPLHKLPLIPGHEVVGIVVQRGDLAQEFPLGARIGVPWLAGSCGACDFCRMQRENLCDAALYTGYDLNGGYAQYMVADARYAFLIPEQYDDAHAAPLLCAGLIGYRAYAMTGDAKRIGLYGYGAAAHIIAQIARHEGREVFSFTRRGDTRSQQFALALGAAQNPQMFQTGWFLESLLSQTLVVHVIRTGKIPFMESRPSLPLLVTTISICLFGLWLPASPLAHALGLTPMPYAYFAALLGILMAYLLLA